jgi:hypothetical protein
VRLDEIRLAPQSVVLEAAASALAGSTFRNAEFTTLHIQT